MAVTNKPNCGLAWPKLAVKALAIFLNTVLDHKEIQYCQQSRPKNKYTGIGVLENRSAVGIGIL